MKKIFTLVFFILIYHSGFSQAWDWTKTSGDYINSVSIDPQQFFVSASSGGSAMITKRDRDGNLAWQKTFTRSNGTGMYGLLTDNNGNIYTSNGRYDSIDHIYTGPQGAINKFDFNGNLLWSRTFKWLDASDLDRGDICSKVIAKDDQDNIYVTGIVNENYGINYGMDNMKMIFGTDTTSLPGPGSYIVIAKIDPNGQKLWIKAFKYTMPIDAPHRTSITSVAVKNGQVAIAGISNMTTIYFDATAITGFKGTNFLTLLNANDGNVKWVKNIKFNSFQFACMSGCDAAPARVVFSNNNKIVFSSAFMDTLRFAGILYSSYAKKQYYISQYDTSGTEERFKIFPNDYLGNGDITVSIPFYSDQTIVKAGSGYYYHVLSHLYKLDSAYNITWTSTNTLWYSGTIYPVFSHAAMAADPGGHMIAQVSAASANSLAGQETLNPFAPGVRYSYISRINTDYNIVSGYTFYDTNGNGIKDAGEAPAKNIVVGVAAGNRFIGLSDTSGLYECLADTGSFTFSPLRIPSYHTLMPSSYNITMNSYNQHIINKNFALRPIAGVNDLQIDMTAATTIRPGFPGFYQVNIFNKGTTTQSGSCSVRLSASSQYNFAVPVPDAVTADSLVFNYLDLAPGTARSFYIYYTTNPYTAIGDTVICYAAVTPVANDSVKSDNYDTLKVIVRGSFDPNDKEVNLAGDVSIDKKSDWLEYTIRFQNTGNDTAFNIRVIDTLLISKLDIKSFELLSSTHPVQAAITNDKVLAFYFNNILLVDSFHNERLSHGMVKFRIKPVSGIQVNDSITNRAAIYFDYNAPVITNTVKTKYAGFPTVNLGSDITICGGPVNLNAGNTGAQFVWSTGAVTQTISITGSGTYWVRVTNSYGYSASDTIQVTVNAKPVVNLGNDITQCGGNIVLNAGNPGSSYLWNNGTASSTLNVTAPGTYWVKVTNTNGCTASDTVQVSINALPVVNLGNDIVQCGGNALLNAGNSGSSYLWSNGTTSATLNVTSTGAYWVKVTNANGCIGQDTIQVNINSIPAVQLGNDTAICSGNQFTLNAGNAGAAYLWSNGSTANSLVINQGGTYFVRVTNTAGCSNADTIQVTLRAKPVLQFNRLDTLYINDAAVLLAASPTGGQFSGPGVLNGSFDPAVAGPGLHSLQYNYTDAYGCSAGANALVYVNEAPGNVNVYPNPNHGSFSIILPKGLRNTMLRIVTPSGMLVGRYTVYSTRQNLTVSLQPGVYYFQFSNTGFCQTSRIIIW